MCQRVPTAHRSDGRGLSAAIPAPRSQRRQGLRSTISHCGAAVQFRASAPVPFSPKLLRAGRSWCAARARRGRIPRLFECPGRSARQASSSKWWKNGDIKPPLTASEQGAALARVVRMNASRPIAGRRGRLRIQRTCFTDVYQRRTTLCQLAPFVSRNPLLGDRTVDRLVCSVLE